ncbi:MAG: thiol-activated cytolysin family protein [Burkholderiaceae bacterium]|jgi:thiol-activated cytolysin|nr:thiol-activated cytolysin family protein [Burkholderiaceae bacterium]
MKRKIIPTLVALACCASVPAYADSSIDDYVFKLKYKPEQILSVTEPGSTESLPVRDGVKNGVIICTNEPAGLTTNIDNFTVLNPAGATMFAGALVRADRNLAQGRPSIISIDRAPATIRVDLPGLGESGTAHIGDINYASYQSALNNMLEKWNATAAAKKGYANASRSLLTTVKADSDSQLALSLGFSTTWADNKITSNLKVNTTNKSSSVVSLYRQVFYTVTFDPPKSPARVFGEGITQSELARREIGNNAPPAFVQTVDYGRLIFVRMDTASSSTGVDLEGAMSYALSGNEGAKIDASLESKYKSVIANSTFSVMTVGGNAQVATQIYKPSELDKLHKLIKDNALYTRNNPGYPIAYSVAFLKDNALAALNASTNYVKKNCVEHANGYVRFRHAGAYIARVSVNWEETNPKYQPGKAGVEKMISQSWSSGNQTAGWSKTVDLPGDATNIRIKAEAKTGLVWNPWGEIISTTLAGPNNQCYKFKGATLHRSWKGC